MCVIDDQQWLDRASAQVLGFVARRLAAESVGLVFAARVPTSDVAGLSRLSVQGLGPADARALLDTEVAVPLKAGYAISWWPKHAVIRWRCWNGRGR